MIAFYQLDYPEVQYFPLLCGKCFFLFFQFIPVKGFVFNVSPQFLHFLQALGTSIPHDLHFWNQNSKKKMDIAC